MAIEKDDDLETGLEDGGEEQEVVIEGEHAPEHDEEGDEETEASAKRDTEIEGAVDDEERERIRERRREERKNKQKRQREKIESQEREIQSLRATLNQLAEQVSGVQNATLTQSLNALDQEIARADQAAKHFGAIAADAVTKQDGKTWHEAQERATFAMARVNELRALKQNVTQGMQQQQTRPQPADPVVARNATQFTQKHSWYGGVQSKDPDSRVLTAIDLAMTEEGWDPRTPSYWEELESRMGKYLPHRVQKDNTERRTVKQPVAGSNSAAPSGGASTFRLSPERVQALKDSGEWQDPKRRAAAVERYRKWDAEHGIKG